MDLMTLDANYQRSKLIENYDSLIWTERFNTIGDFQLTCNPRWRNENNQGFLDLLPEGTVLNIRESTVPMIVETHKIERKKNQPEVLTISGRAFESILDRRAIYTWASAGGALVDLKMNLRIPSDVAYYLMYQICVAGLLDANDIFPSAQVQFNTPADYNNTSGPVRQYTATRGNLLAYVLQLLQTESKADPSTTPATPAVVQHGIKSTIPNGSGTAIAISIYTGTDRTASVYFDATRGLLDDGTYLFSKAGSANTAYILGSDGTVAKMDGSGSAQSGLARRVTLVDATSSSISTSDSLKAEGSNALSQAPVTAMFDGSINQDISPYLFNVHYGLGDVVKLVGDYGLTANARVTEYIRSVDNTGYKSYPTLTTITP